MNEHQLQCLIELYRSFVFEYIVMMSVVKHKSPMNKKVREDKEEKTIHTIELMCYDFLKK